MEELRAPEGERPAERALALAYRYLGRRERTCAEVRAHLEARGVDPALAEEAISELGEQGYLDDGRFACLYVHDRRELDGWGRDRIARGLTERGLERELIEAALAEEPDTQGQELERALALLRRRFSEPPSDAAGHERALGLLLRRGYESELAYRAVRLFARGQSPDDP